MEKMLRKFAFDRRFFGWLAISVGIAYLPCAALWCYAGRDDQAQALVTTAPLLILMGLVALRPRFGLRAMLIVVTAGAVLAAWTAWLLRDTPFRSF